MSFLVSYNPKILKSQISCFAVLAWTPTFVYYFKYSPDVFNSFYRTVTHGGTSHRIFTGPPLSCSISASFTKEPLPYVHLPFFFFHYSPPNLLQRIQDFNRSWRAFSLIVFPLQTKFPFWRFFPTRWNTL